MVYTQYSLKITPPIVARLTDDVGRHKIHLRHT